MGQLNERQCEHLDRIADRGLRFYSIRVMGGPESDNWIANVSVEGLPTTGSNYGAGSWYNLSSGKGIRFTASSSMVAIWGFNQGGDVNLFQDGVSIATVYNTVPSATWEDCFSQAALIRLQTMNITSPEVPRLRREGEPATSCSGLLRPIRAALKQFLTTSLPVDTFFGDSITADLMVNDFRQGDEWAVTQAVAHSPNREGNPSQKMAFGLANVSQVPASSTRVWERFGFNDANQSTTIEQSVHRERSSAIHIL